MSNQAATVVYLQGQAWAQAADGSTRELQVGDTIAADERLITADSTQIQLDFGDGQPVYLAGVHELTMNPDFWPESITSADEAQAFDAEFTAILDALDENEQLLLAGEGDLLEALEAPAAGDGNTAADGHSFVQLSRINENVGEQSFNYDQGNVRESGEGTSLDAAVNAPPEADDASLTTAEDTPVSGQVDATDANGQPLVYALLDTPTNGSVALNPATGEYTYTPNENYNGDDSFSVVVSDGESTTTSIVSVIVTPANDAPEAEDQTLTTPEDTPISSQVDATDVDLPEGDLLTYALNQQPANGSVSLDAETGEFIYTPNPDYFGPDQFTVTVTDSSGATDTAVIDIVVTPVNDAPVAVDDGDDGPLATAANTVTTGNALDNDFDIDSSPISVLSYVVEGDDTVYAPGDTATMSGVGSFTLLENGDLSFTPLTGYSGDIPDVIYTITDGELTDSAVIRFDGIPGVGQPGGPVPPTASIVLDANITPDDIISAAEAGTNIAITGSTGGDVVEGDTVTLTVNGETYTGDVDGDGNFSIEVAGSDLAADANSTIEASVTTSTGNVNGEATATDSEGYALNVTAPSLSISVDETTNVVTFTFSEEITDFDITDVDATNGSVANLIQVNATTWTADLTPANDFEGDVTVSVDDDSYTDLAGNPGTGASDSITVDTDAPSVQVNFVDSELAIGESGEVTFVFSGPVSGFDISSLSVVGGSITSLTVDPGDTTTYTGIFVPSTNFEGEASVEVTAGSYTDSTGNPGSSGSDSIAVVGAPPLLQLTAPELISEGLTHYTWDNFSGSASGGAGMDPGTLQSQIDASALPGGSTISIVQSGGAGIDRESTGFQTSSAEDQASLVSGFIFLEAGVDYAFVGQGDDSIRVMLGGQEMASATFGGWDNSQGPVGDQGKFWGDAVGVDYTGLNSSNDRLDAPWIEGSEFSVAESGYYQFDMYHHNQFDNGFFFVDLMADDNLQTLSTDNYSLFADVADIIAQGANVSDTQVDSENGFVFYRDYGVNEGEENTSIRLSEIQVDLAHSSISTLTLTMSGIPEGAELSDGENDFLATVGDTEIEITDWDLTNLSLTPADDFTGSFSLSVSAEATYNSGWTASSIVAIDVLVYADDGSLPSMLSESAGATLIGGEGDDELIGGVGADTFVWSLGDQGTSASPAQDTLVDFNSPEGGSLVLGNLLYDGSAGNLTEYLHFEQLGSDTLVHMSSSGSYNGSNYSTATDQKITLEGVSLTGSDADIINQLLASGQLNVDQ